MLRRLLACLTLALTACHGAPGYLSYSGEAPEDDEIWRPNPSDDSGDDEPGLSGVDPVVFEADAWCYTTEDAGDWWGLRARGDDPQGAESLESFVMDGVTVLAEGGATVAVVALVCEADGACWSSGRAEQLAAPCQAASTFDFAFAIEDIEGHRSEVVTVQGRRGSGPNG